MSGTLLGRKNQDHRPHGEDCYRRQISMMNAEEQSGGLQESVLSLWQVRRGGPKEVMCKLRPEE